MTLESSNHHPVVLGAMTQLARVEGDADDRGALGYRQGVQRVPGGQQGAGGKVDAGDSSDDVGGFGCGDPQRVGGCVGGSRSLRAPPVKLTSS